MSSCDNCLWEYEGDCVSENLDVVAEEHFINTYEEIVNLLDRRKCSELEEVLEFIKNQRAETCTHKERRFDLANEICIEGNVYADTYCTKCGKLIGEKEFLCERR